MRFSHVAVVGIGFTATLTTALALGQDTAKPAAPAPAPASTPPAATVPAPASGALKTSKDKLSYIIGIQVGRQLAQAAKNDMLDVDPDLVGKAIKDVLGGGKLLLTDQEIMATQQEVQKELIAKKMAAMDAQRKLGDTFLVENKAKPGVVTLPSGLQYKVLKEGTGPIPTATDRISAHYKGTLVDGTEFDSSYKRNLPLVIPVNGVIQGWSEALQKMKVGSKWQLFIPSNLAYGAQGKGSIPPNSTLLFEMELLGIEPAGAGR
jgi:FKBP-type peptidyl-prolyl cis-trans isomerase FklB